MIRLETGSPSPEEAGDGRARHDADAERRRGCAGRCPRATGANGPRFSSGSGVGEGGCG